MLRLEEIPGRFFPAVPVPMDAQGAIHPRASRAYADWMAARPIGGVAVWAHTGRGLLLTPGQRDEVLTTWKAALPGHTRIIAAAGAPRTARQPEAVIEAARAMAAQARDLGADAVLVHPPTPFRGRPDQDRLVLEYHDSIAGIGLPLILFYLYEAAGGLSYNPVVLAQLLARPDVLGIKVATLDGVMTYQSVAALIRDLAPDKVLITGEDRFLGYSLMAGARAALIGMGAACTTLQADFLDHFWSGRPAEFLAANAAIDELAMHTFLAPMEGYIQRMLWCLVHQGVLPAEAAFDPFGPKLGAIEFDQIGDCLRRIGVI